MALVNAGLLPAEPALHYGHGQALAYSAPYGYNSHYSDAHLAHGVQSQNILRTHGGTVSHISKSVVSPHSHVSKVDTRISNEGHLAYASPALHHGYSAPLAYSHHQPALLHAAPVAYGHGYAHQSAPLAYSHHHQPALVHSAQHVAPLAYSHHQPALIAQPLAHSTHLAAPLAYSHGHHGSHAVVSYSSPISSYGW